MNAAIRAHRILSVLANYQEVGGADSWPSKLSGESLGQPIGCYRNSEREDDFVGIFSDGIAWLDREKRSELRFIDISAVILPEGKESEGLLLKTRHGRELNLPIRGRRGRFFDSLEMLRFLDRILKDIRC